MSKAKLMFLAFMICASLIVDAQTINIPADTELALAGEIRRVHGYGPPGYGEDKKRDARITYWVLELTKPVDVLPCTPERPEWASADCNSTKRLRLFFPTSLAN